VLQAVKIVSQAQQQCLAALRKQTAAGSTRGEFAFDGRKDGFHQGATAVQMSWEMAAHLGAYAVKVPGALAAFSGDDAASVESLANMGMVELAVELGIGQHQADGADRLGGIDQGAQVGAVVGGAGVGHLGQQELPLHVHRHQPLQPAAPGHRLLGVMMHATDEERADGALAEAGRIHGDVGTTPRTGQGHALYHLVQGTSNRRLVQAAQETVQRSVIRDREELQRTAQFGMFCQPHLGFAVGPVLVAHEAQDGQQLRLRELMFAKTRATPRHGGSGYVQGHLWNRTKAHFGHSEWRILAKLLSSITPFAANILSGFSWAW